MLNPTTKGVHISRDITWLRRRYFPLLSLEAEEGVVMPLDPAELHHSDGGDGNSTVLVSRIPPNDLAELAKYNTPLAATPHAKETESENNTEDTTTRSGRISRLPCYLRDELHAKETESENNAEDTITRSGRISRLPEYLRDEFETANLGMDDDYQSHLPRLKDDTMSRCINWNSGFHAATKMMVLRQPW
jgi:hypothetical protein